MTYAADTLAETAWEDAKECEFGAAWNHEIAELPAFSEKQPLCRDRAAVADLAPPAGPGLPRLPTADR